MLKTTTKDNASKRKHRHTAEIPQKATSQVAKLITAGTRPNDISAQCNNITYSDSKVHGATMGPIWGRQGPGGPHGGPMKFAIWVIMLCSHYWQKMLLWIINDWLTIFPNQVRIWGHR